MIKNDLPQKLLTDTFEDIGKTIKWRIARANVKAGTEVWNIGNNGYYRVKFFKKMRPVHRVLWIMRNGEIPDGMEIDHIDGDKLNNSPDNLRLASPSQNSWNKKFSHRISSGVKGVSWYKPTGKWKASIAVNGISKHVGYFLRKPDAELAVRAARERLHGEFANHE